MIMLHYKKTILSNNYKMFHLVNIKATSDTQGLFRLLHQPLGQLVELTFVFSPSEYYHFIGRIIYARCGR